MKKHQNYTANMFIHFGLYLEQLNQSYDVLNVLHEFKKQESYKKCLLRNHPEGGNLGDNQTENSTVLTTITGM
jgi:hypothetical protein